MGEPQSQPDLAGPPSASSTRVQPPHPGGEATRPLPGAEALAQQLQPPRAGELRPGQVVDDFELLSVLGQGGFATVYLARQISLGRQIALKVSTQGGSEAHTLAVLEHDHIVRVFSHSVEARSGLRLLCMQYVNGTTLQQVIRALADRRDRPLAGRDLVAAIDSLSTRPALFDPAALHDRDFLLRADFVEAVCWLGARLAQALEYAHQKRVLHRDIKPGNILLSCYGRPLLADFNLSLDPDQTRGRGELFGGTLNYMAPEHLDAVNPADPTTPEAVDERSDVYALGVVLYELWSGRRPFGPPPEADTAVQLRALAAQRRAGPPRLAAPEILERVVRRCLEPEPARRYPTAAALAEALEGCREHHEALKAAPPAGPLTRFVARHPFALGLVLIFLPHVVGSAVNITYNALRIVGRLTAEQQATFLRLVLGYNLVVYSACIAMLVVQVTPLVRSWRRLGDQAPDHAATEALRRRALGLPFWTIILSCAGWLPGGLLFPLGIHWLAGPLGGDIFGHFLVSFTVSGLIALTYSVFAAQFLALCVLYPRYWVDARAARRTAAVELGHLPRRIACLQWLAGLIPLIGAILMVGVGPEDFSPAAYRTFRVLVTFLIALGMAGFGAALLAGQRLGQTLRAWLAAPV